MLHSVYKVFFQWFSLEVISLSELLLQLSPTFIVLFTGEPESCVEVSQHVFVFAGFPEIMDGVGQLLLPEQSQLLFLLRRQRHVGGRVFGVRGGSLWMRQVVMSVIKINKRQKAR